ncbi:hypothetical protein [Pseudidiomarina donghaiensis]|uniref:Uncharacterized protein n=1 Tax=Pseudidiomarina donghaiensis TaxID=519452 RepID=A0A432XD69_9GAMM|nr:hypothetical protein [Pseudidiomarina donghaiensis]RUO46704.1 hypothetical protein CWE24_10690 [Pseudidiomarina donghaiensis]
MFIFSEESRWKNIAIIAAFFVFGILLVEPFLPGLFILIAIVCSRCIAKEQLAGKIFFDKENLVEFSSDYYFAFYRMLLSGSYIIVAFRHSNQFTLDIAFFLVWFVGYVIYWYTTFFIPSNGEFSPVLRNHAIIGALFSSIFLLAMFSWIITNFNEFSWFSGILTNPLEAIFKFGKAH